MEKQIETLITILHELRDEWRRDCETTIVRDEVVAEPSLRRHRIEEIPLLVDQPYGMHSHRSTGRIPGECVDEGRETNLALSEFWELMAEERILMKVSSDSGCIMPSRSEIK